MALEHLEGAVYGPMRSSIAAAKVAEYVAATGDDPDRWINAAPPAYAGALLFTVAPQFLSSDAVSGHTAVLIHADQVFAWHAPLAVGSDVVVAGRVDRVRARGGVDFVTFGADVTSEDGTVLLESTSTFLLGAEPTGEPPQPRPEPAVADRAGFGPIGDPIDGDWPDATRSASRADLVRYAGASGDFNPIHFDHDAAVGAGLAGVVVHGLLMGAWLLQPAATLRSGERPVTQARLRFRNPLYAGEAATLTGSIGTSGGDVDLRLTRSADGTLLVGAKTQLAEE
jgi:acyl dehydratase